MRSGQLRLNPGSFDINGTVHAVFHMLKDMRKGDEIELINRISPGEFFVYADENRFRQIIFNLVGNSLKYTEKGYVEVRAATSGSQVIITVSDTGIGMDEGMKASLFQGAVQSGEANFTGTHSSGLGLSISRMLAVGMNGELRLHHSEPGAGTNIATKRSELERAEERVKRRISERQALLPKVKAETLRVTLFGPLTVLVGESTSPIRWMTAKCAETFAYLLLHGRDAAYPRTGCWRPYGRTKQGKKGISTSGAR